MPERNLNPDGTVNLDASTVSVNDPEAIAHCHRCDRDGYRGTVVCDHRDRVVGPGREAAMAALAEIRHRKVERAREKLESDRPASTETDEISSGDHLGAEGLK